MAGSRARPGKGSLICALPAAGWAGHCGSLSLRPDLAASAIASGSASLSVCDAPAACRRRGPASAAAAVTRAKTRSFGHGLASPPGAGAAHWHSPLAAARSGRREQDPGPARSVRLDQDTDAR